MWNNTVSEMYTGSGDFRTRLVHLYSYATLTVLDYAGYITR